MFTESTLITLSETVVMKKRYRRWYLVDAKEGNIEKFALSQGSNRILEHLFLGQSLEEVQSEFDLDKETLEGFIGQLEDYGLVTRQLKPIDQSHKIYKIEPPLDSLNILLTNACNLKCKHCYLNGGKAIAQELNGAEWQDVISQAIDLGITGLNISGGEPLLHPDFSKIIKYIRSFRPLVINLNTNGTMIDECWAKKLAGVFSSVQISLDHHIPKQHDFFRGVSGSFDKTIESIKLLINHGVQTNIAFVLTSANSTSIIPLIELCEKLGVNTLNIGLVANIGRAVSNLESKLGSRDIDRIYMKILEVSQIETSLKVLLPFRIGNNTKKPKKYICDGDNNQILYVLSDGSAMPCDKLPKNKFVYGNVRSWSLRQIWQSQKMKQFKLKKVIEIERCGSCQLLALCGGPCVARSYTETETISTPDCLSCAMACKYAETLSQEKK